METRTMTLTDFLLVRIAEDEAEARALVDDPIHGPGDLVPEKRGKVFRSYDGDFLNIDPARVLAECEAKRRIVELHAEDNDGGERNWPYCLSCGTYSGTYDSMPVEYPCPTLRALASAYADHPDYRDEWR